MRLSDILYLGLLQLPLRCYVCMERFHVGYRLAFQQIHWQRSRSFLVREAEHRRVKTEGKRIEPRKDIHAAK